MFADPLGMEQIVVSGGDYSNDSVHSGFSYNFIEPAIRKIVELRNANSNENISWLIADSGWSDADWGNFSSAVSGMNVNVVKIQSAQGLIDYLNNKNGGDSRANDKITGFTLFSHGFKNVVSLGYNYNDDSYNTGLNFYTNDISQLNSDAFDNPISWFGSCNTGTGGSKSFAQTWANKVGGETYAFEGKSTYEYTMFPREYGGIFNKAARFLGASPWNDYKNLVEGLRSDYGFSKIGSINYPEAASGARMVKFTR